jgi:hypothetical protein
MPPGADGKHYRTYGQAERFGKKPMAEEKTDNSEGGNEVDSGKNVMMIKHGGTKEAPAPPFHVKHADGSKHGPMDSKEELMSHMHEHLGGGDMENEDMDSDYGSEGSKQALDSLLG